MGVSGSNQNPEKDPRSDSPFQPEVTESGVVPHILVVEDNEADAFLIQTAIFSATVPVIVHLVKDGDQAIRFCDAADGDASKPCPDVVILDINLPKKQGGDVLKHIRAGGRCSKAHVIIVSTSDSHRDREQMVQLGADAYFRKPSDYDEFMKLGDLINSVIGKQL